MKTIAILLLVALALAVVVVLALYLVLRQINEERKRTCGKCDFCDRDLNHCWMRDIPVGENDPACITYSEREHEG